MSTTQLTVLGQSGSALATQQGGLGIDFSSRFFQLRPATLSINQPNTQVEGALKGKLRLSDTGDQYDHLFCTLLKEPIEKRAYYVKTGGELNRNPENLLCLCSEVKRNRQGVEISGPDDRSKVAQALRCTGCSKSSWDKWRQTKSKDDLPPCDLYYYVLLIDTKYKMPMQMYIRSKAKKTFDEGMEKLARRLSMMSSQGKNPNIFDVGFTLKTKQIKTNNMVSYVPELTDFRAISDEERAEFGELYQAYASRANRQDDPELEAAEQIDQAANTIDAQVTGDVGVIQDGEIAI